MNIILGRRRSFKRTKLKDMELKPVKLGIKSMNAYFDADDPNVLLNCELDSPIIACSEKEGKITKEWVRDSRFQMNKKAAF